MESVKRFNTIRGELMVLSSLGIIMLLLVSVSAESNARQDEGSIPRDPAVEQRPQDPVAPLPYDVTTVVIPHPDGHQLAGDLVLPHASPRPPIAILLTGSGPQDRDESIMGHRPFLVLADHLARNGIASLRCDDRGVASSTGTFAGMTSIDFSTDALAQFDWLTKRSDIDVASIGFVGHSEGGLVGSIAATVDPRVDWLVMMAGPGIDGGEILTSQTKRIMEQQAHSSQNVEAIVKLHRVLMDRVREEAGDAAVEQAYRDLSLAQIEIAAATPEQKQALRDQLERLTTSQMINPWLSMFIRIDPAEYLTRVRCPILALNGTEDLQVISELNLPAIKRAVDLGGGSIQIVAYDGLNHMFQKSVTGTISEYEFIETTIEPQVLQDISKWIRSVTLNEE
jgi:hypothetical protein